MTQPFRAARCAPCWGRTGRCPRPRAGPPANGWTWRSWQGRASVRLFEAQLGQLALQVLLEHVRGLDEQLQRHLLVGPGLQREGGLQQGGEEALPELLLVRRQVHDNTLLPAGVQRGSRDPRGAALAGHSVRRGGGWQGGRLPAGPSRQEAEWRVWSSR